VTEGRPTTPTRRPPNARRRRADEEEPKPPSPDELTAMERGLVDLSVLAGASSHDDPSLGVRLVQWPGRGAGFNYGTLIRWADDGWRDAAERLAARLRSLGEHPSVLVADGLSEPEDLTTRLTGIGWREAGSEIVCWTRRAAVVPHLDPDLRIESLTPRALGEYERVEREVFGLDATGAPDRTAALAVALEARRLRGYLVRLDGAPVAVTRLVDVDGLACLSGVGVLAAHRGKGFGALVTTVATRAGLATGHPLVWLSVDPENAPAWRLYSNLDYRPAFRWRRLIGPAPR
jgi:ribosomal protein S18 acetylase RimI-like enzyme